MKLGRSLSLVTAVSLAAAALTPAALATDVDRNPIGFLSGPDTGLINPTGLALDKAGNRYVANAVAASVTVYAPSASGNAAPIRKIQGDQTTLVGPRSVTVADDGTLYVGDLFGAGTNKVAVFAPGANGDVAPIRVITGDNTGLSWPQALDLDSAGRLFVANKAADSITVYIPGASGNAAPLRTITGDATGLHSPTGLALQSNDTIHVVNSGSESVTTYAAGAAGNATPTRTIVGDNTGFDLASGLALDTLNNVYVSNGTLSGAHAIAVFSPTAQGNASPVVRLAGPNTDLNAVDGLAVDARHQVIAASLGGESILLTYAPLVPLPRPGLVRNLRVSGPADALKRTITWKAPTPNGAKVTGYRIYVKKGLKPLVANVVGPDRRKLVIKRRALLAGTNKVLVTALSAAGSGRVASKTFTVVK